MRYLNLLLISFAILLFSIEVAVSDDHSPLLLATGSKAGIYYPYGTRIAKAAKTAGLTIDVLSSKGSRENLIWLSEGKAHLCFAQSDTVYNAYNGTGGFTKKIVNIRMIASLYPEIIHILVRNSLFIKKVEDFKGKCIAVGPKLSGTESNAITVLEASGITPNEVQLINMPFENSINALRKNEVDIVFITAGIPSGAVKAATSNGAYLFELQPDILQRIIDKYPFFFVNNILPGTYNNQDNEITAIGVSALLIGRTDLDKTTIHKLVNSLFNNKILISKFDSKAKDLDLGTVFKGNTIPISEGANNYYKEKGLYRKAIYQKLLNYFLIVLIVFIFIMAFKKRRTIKFFFKTKEILRVFVFLLLVWCFGSTILYFAEHRINESYSTLWLSFWAGLVNLINFGTKEPFTATGRITMVIISVLGLGSVAWFTGEVASIYVHKRMTGGRKKMETMHDHYVLLNWNQKGYGIIEQIHSKDLGEKIPILVISEFVEDIVLPERYEFENVFIIKGNPLSEVILRRAKVDRAHSIIILAQEDSSQMADAQAILLILAIRKICLENKQNNVPIIAEILDPQKIDLATYAGFEDKGKIEIVSSKNIEKNLLSHTAVNPGLTKLLDVLLTYDEVGGEIYSQRIPAKLAGKSYDELMGWVIELRRKKVNIVPIAISRKGKMYVNPSSDQLNQLEDDDYLFAICNRKEDLKELENI